MELRTPWMPDDGSGPAGGAGTAGAAPGTGPAAAPPGMADLVLAGFPGGAMPTGATLADGGVLRWRVNSGMTALKIAGAAVFLVVALLYVDDPVGLGLGLLAAVLLAAFGLRDLLAPVRLAADPTGVTVVRGYLGRRHLAWADIERIRVDERRRLGTRSQLLEIDSGDTLYLLSGYELCAPTTEVAEVLTALRTAALS